MNSGESYPFIFQMNDYFGHDDLLECTMQYRFRSAKSNHTYIVRVERYVEHTYCVKFFDKANMLSGNKFSIRTHTHEPRKIFNTIFQIMLDVYRRDPKASFFFIGAEDEKDVTGKETRRFRVYSVYAPTVVSSVHFLHARITELSLYVLVNRLHVSDPQGYVKRLASLVAKAMTMP